jgi:hypothetical protein
VAWFQKLNLRNQDKGQHHMAAAFVDAIRRGAESPIGFAELLEVSRTTNQLAALAARKNS